MAGRSTGARHEILEWDPSCSSRCLKKAHAPWSLLRGRSLRTWVRFRRSTTTSGASSVRVGRRLYPRTDRTTVPSSSSREPPPLEVVSSRCPRPEREAIGEIPGRVPGSGDNPPVIVPGRCRVLLRGEEGRHPETLHRLPGH